MAATSATMMTGARPAIAATSSLGYSTPAQVQRARAQSKSTLTWYLPESGYFVAGALAGGISRTATAPLDRLKVYLLVNTKPGANSTLDAAKHGHPLTAVRNAAKPIGDAMVGLYRAGGLRTFFAGMSRLPLLGPCTCIACLESHALSRAAGNGLNVVKIMPETAIKVSKSR